MAIVRDGISSPQAQDFLARLSHDTHITIELDQARDQSDQALAETIDGGVLVTGQGKPSIVRYVGSAYSGDDMQRQSAPKIFKRVASEAGQPDEPLPCR